METEKIEIVTPITNTKILLKSWLTGREKREITGSILQEAEFKSDALDKPIFKGNVLQKMEDISIKMIVIKINDEDLKPEEILDRILDLRSEEYDFIIKEINKINSSEEDKVKK